MHAARVWRVNALAGCMVASKEETELRYNDSFSDPIVPQRSAYGSALRTVRAKRKDGPYRSGSPVGSK